MIMSVKKFFVWLALWLDVAPQHSPILPIFLLPSTNFTVVLHWWPWLVRRQIFWLEPSDVASSCVSKVNRLYAPSEVTCVRLTWSPSFLFLPACLHTPKVDHFGYGPSHRGHQRPTTWWLHLIYKPLPPQREHYPPFAYPCLLACSKP